MPQRSNSRSATLHLHISTLPFLTSFRLLDSRGNYLLLSLLTLPRRSSSFRSTSIPPLSSPASMASPSRSSPVTFSGGAVSAGDDSDRLPRLLFAALKARKGDMKKRNRGMRKILDHSIRSVNYYNPHFSARPWCGTSMAWWYGVNAVL
ncbi:uncharacterized protein LOC108510832 isoform X2 [Phoenix dactylifera]|uniref:Uncharacterized protein LOC108510832 isoform X2 n=1 Tax=Phoenix dactylifera TaxID=42345 RepID=A0A8B9A2N7_PHODC|nr:uncharacterized protein LOC108510832 isoform X2 [Phoenix dactylifera]